MNQQGNVWLLKSAGLMTDQQTNVRTIVLKFDSL